MIVLAIEALGVLIYMCLMRFSVLKNRGTKVKVAFLLLIGLIILSEHISIPQEWDWI